MLRRSRINYQLEDKFDVILFFSAMFLVVIGLLAIYSSTVNHPTASGNFQKQVFWLCISLCLFFATYFANPRLLNYVPIPAYLITLLFLVAVLVIGRKVYGQRCWIDIGPFGFQPSEFSKVATVFLLSFFLSREKTDINTIKDIAIAMAIGLIPVGLILLEPDMGSALIFFSITLVMLFWKGLDIFGIFVVLSPGLVVFASMFGMGPFIAVLVLILLILFYFRKNLFLSASIFVMNLAAGFFFDAVYKVLSPHQKKLIETFVDPNSDPLGSGYNAIQVKVAIGSGGFLGKGFMHGNQTQLRFIPEQWTDFIFCVVGEEFGFIGTVITISLFLALFTRLLKIASFAKEKNEYHSLLVVGILSILFAHFAVNISMNVGLLPIIGIPLPYMSYGGSSLMVNLFMLGVAANIYKNRKQHA
ncbi:MAG: rod shape-determining protein RodA [Bacteroidota bacterium]|nr:rod shape-determining protein RodA [Bacteroidota bacterium]MDP4190867.1 rod shape-determining protein RodA [Bacteroidota bacterium]MDP4193904.1 rod shape-determining protein RodA [Bacteroidota bacterium]